MSRLRSMRRAGKISSDKANDGRVLVRVQEILQVASEPDVPDVVVLERGAWERLVAAVGQAGPAEERVEKAEERADHAQARAEQAEAQVVALNSQIGDERRARDRLEAAADQHRQTQERVAQLESQLRHSQEQLQQAEDQQRRDRQEIDELGQVIRRLREEAEETSDEPEPADDTPVAAITVPLSVDAELPKSSRLRRRLRNMFVPPG